MKVIQFLNNNIILLKMNTKSKFLIATLLLFGTHGANAQCPNISIDAKYDHIPQPIYNIQGWDTAVTCAQQGIALTTTAFVTTQHFNGTYTVESIPYNPPDSTFRQGTRLSNINRDDYWDNAWTPFDFPFQFFGVTKNQALVGPNGLITFNSAVAADSYCAYSYNVPIPNSSFTSGYNSYGAIYGVYEDIDPNATQDTYGSYTTPGAHSGWGIYKYVGGTYPCRYISTSVNDIVLYGNHSKSSTYSIVCWEGTNVIDVYIKHRSCCSSTNSGKGLVGIMNDAGTSAFCAPGRGNDNGSTGWTGEVDREAWRFTPQGTTAKNVQWWMITPEGDSIEVGQTASHPNAAITHAYYTSPDHMTCYVEPTVTTKYKATIKYNGATGYFYYLCDTITVGVDTATNMTINSDRMNPNAHYAESCYGGNTNFSLQIPNTQHADEITWNVVRKNNGANEAIPSTRYTLSNNNMSLTLRPSDAMLENRIDTIIVYSTIRFSNGCDNNDSLVYYVYPNYDLKYQGGICDGESYRMWGQNYTVAGDYTKTMQTILGCDSVEHLHLVVSSTSLTIDTVRDCQPYTWINGRTYTESNGATMATDTLTLTNRFGCDSIVRLNLTILPVVAQINATPSAATMDNLAIMLSDISTGSKARDWNLPDGTINQSSIITYNFPSDRDSVVVGLTAYSHYGQCTDDTTITLRLLKESIYMPNAFTPDGDNNKIFHAYGNGILTYEIHIYNRNGELVCHYDTLDGYWDGKNLQGANCPQGVYTYIMRYTNVINPNSVQVKHGTVTLIR